MDRFYNEADLYLFLIAFTQGSHDFRFDMGRMGIRAGKLTSPEFFDGSTCAQYV